MNWTSSLLLLIASLFTLGAGRSTLLSVRTIRGGASVYQTRYSERIANESFFLPGKKLIAATFPYSPSEYSADIADLEQRPYDGVLFMLDGGYRGFLSPTAWDASAFDTDYQALTSMTPSTFTDNFILFRMGLDSFDWFDDSAWNATLTNTLLMTKAVVLGRCAGLFLDAEAPSDPFKYSTAIGYGVHSWGDFTNQVFARGKNWIETVQAAAPRIYVMWAFFWSTDLTSAPWTSAATIQAGLPNNQYALLPAFINGMIDGAADTTFIVNGNEPGFYYRTEREFTDMADVHMDVLYPAAYIQPDLRDKWASQTQNGPPIYPNWLQGRRYGTISQSMTDSEHGLWHEHNVYWALKTADRYAWDWFEGSGGLWGDDWQTTEPDPYVLPITYISSTESAVAKVTADQPLGYTSASIFDGLKARAIASVPSAEIPVAASPPTIDGDSSDAIWSSAVALSPFVEAEAMTNRVFQTTAVKLIYDANNLYLLAICNEPSPGGMHTTGTADAYTVMSDDHVSVNVQSTENVWTLYKFIVNSAGTKADFLLYEDPDAYDYFLPESMFFQPRKYSDGDTTFTAASSVGVATWTCEISIPWSDLDITPVSTGTFKAQFGRYRTQSANGSSYPERTGWGPEYEKRASWELMYPEFLGTLTLE